ncbi:MAG: hypothetical protein WD601_09580 [Pseudohongiellaceae bacterium]
MSNGELIPLRNCLERAARSLQLSLEEDFEKLPPGHKSTRQRCQKNLQKLLSLERLTTGLPDCGLACSTKKLIKLLRPLLHQLQLEQPDPVLTRKLLCFYYQVQSQDFESARQLVRQQALQNLQQIHRHIIQHNAVRFAAAETGFTQWQTTLKQLQCLLWHWDYQAAQSIASLARSKRVPDGTQTSREVVLKLLDTEAILDAGYSAPVEAPAESGMLWVTMINDQASRQLRSAMQKALGKIILELDKRSDLHAKLPTLHQHFIRVISIAGYFQWLQLQQKMLGWMLGLMHQLTGHPGSNTDDPGTLKNRLLQVYTAFAEEATMDQLPPSVTDCLTEAARVSAGDEQDSVIARFLLAEEKLLVEENRNWREKLCAVIKSDAGGQAIFLGNDAVTAFYKLKTNLLALQLPALDDLLQTLDLVLHWHWYRQAAIKAERAAVMACVIEAIQSLCTTGGLPLKALYQLEARLLPDYIFCYQQQVAAQRMGLQSPGQPGSLAQLPMHIAHNLNTLTAMSPQSFASLETVQDSLEPILKELRFVEKCAAILKIYQLETLCSALIEVCEEINLQGDRLSTFPGEVLQRGHNKLLSMLDQAAAWQQVDSADDIVEVLHEWVENCLTGQLPDELLAAINRRSRLLESQLACLQKHLQLVRGDKPADSKAWDTIDGALAALSAIIRQQLVAGLTWNVDSSDGQHTVFARLVPGLRRCIGQLTSTFGHRLHLHVRYSDIVITRHQIPGLVADLQDLFRFILMHACNQQWARRKKGQPRVSRVCLTAGVEKGKVLLLVEDDSSWRDHNPYLLKQLLKKLGTQRLRVDLSENSGSFRLRL